MLAMFLNANPTNVEALRSRKIHELIHRKTGWFGKTSFPSEGPCDWLGVCETHSGSQHRDYWRQPHPEPELLRSFIIDMSERNWKEFNVGLIPE